MEAIYIDDWASQNTFGNVYRIHLNQKQAQKAWNGMALLANYINFIKVKNEIRSHLM